MKTSKQKGNKLERIIATFYARKLDKDARRMPTSGAIDSFKGDILKRIYDGWSDECKSRERIVIYEWWDQAVAQAGNQKPALHVKANHRDPLTVIATKDYFDMREELQDWREKKVEL